MNKLVSVLISLFNEDVEVLKKSIESILNQTYKNIEVIIIDDGLSSRSKDFIDQVRNIDNRIILIKNDNNLGLTKSLNKGLKYCNGDYIARMDGDDISLPKRIEKQVEYMEKNKDIDITGTGVISFGEKVSYLSPSMGMDSETINVNLLFTSCLCHPSVMIRKSFLKKNNLNYNEHFKKAQDYDLWERASSYGKLVVLKDVLLLYRIHDKQITKSYSCEQLDFALDIMTRRLENIGCKVNENTIEYHLALKGLKLQPIKETEEWMLEIMERNNKSKFVNPRVLEKELNMRISLLKARLFVKHKKINKIYFNIKDVKILGRYIMRLCLDKIKLLYFDKFIIAKMEKRA